MTTENRPHPTDFINSQMQESVKTFSVYDGSNRLIEFYTAMVDAKEGEKCLGTLYVYDGASSRVLKSKEILATWQAVWDI